MVLQVQRLPRERQEEKLPGGSERLPVPRNRRPQYRAAQGGALQETHADVPQARRRRQGTDAGRHVI